jgi:hypothetical protein
MPAVTLLAIAMFGILAVAAVPASAENIDLVVMVDTSESMFPYFDDLMNYLVQDLLTTRLHKGDTFHLLSFSGAPEVEIALEVNSEEAAQRAFGRILLLHALGRYTDLVSALQFLSKYTNELPEKNPKQILLITDGINDPPPGSPNQHSAEAVRAALEQASQGMKKDGWKFDILRVPPQPAPGDEGKSYLPEIARTLGVPVIPYSAGDKEHVTGLTTGFPSLSFPSNLGRVGSRFTAPFKIKNWKQEPIIVGLSSVHSNGIELLDRKVQVTVPASGEASLPVPLRLPMSFPQGDQTLQVQLGFDGDLRISPTSGTLAFTFTGKGGIPIPRLTFLYVLYIVLGIGVIYLLVRLFLFMRKRVAEAPAVGMARRETRERDRGGAALAATGRGRGSRAAAAAVPAAERGGAPASSDGRTRGRAQVPLVGSATRAAPVLVVPKKRARPTVTSIRRSLPRQEMQQSNLPPLIEMRVSLQNHRVGFRNVHRLAPGASQTVGGRSSAYLVFLVPVPAAIAEIRNVDGSYVFTPLKAELFPGLSGPVEDCLGKDIPFVSPRGMELSLHFRQWISPLDEINALMRQARSLDMPGKVEKR